MEVPDLDTREQSDQLRCDEQNPNSSPRIVESARKMLSGTQEGRDLDSPTREDSGLSKHMTRPVLGPELSSGGDPRLSADSRHLSRSTQEVQGGHGQDPLGWDHERFAIPISMRRKKSSPRGGQRLQHNQQPQVDGVLSMEETESVASAASVEKFLSKEGEESPEPRWGKGQEHARMTRFVFADIGSFRRAQPRMNLKRYGELATMRCLFPFSIPYILCRFGCRGLSVLDYDCCPRHKTTKLRLMSWGRVALKWTVHIAMIVMLVAFALDDPTESQKGIETIYFFSTLASFLMWIAVTSVKYGIMDEEEFRELPTHKGHFLRRRAENWFKPSQKALAAELRILDRKLKVPTSEVQLVVSPDAHDVFGDQLLAMLPSCFCDNFGRLCVPLDGLLEYIFAQLDENRRHFFPHLMPFVLSSIPTLAPLIAFFVKGGSLVGVQSTTAVSMLCALGVTLFCMRYLYAVGWLGLVDAWRRFYLQRAILELVSRSAAISVTSLLVPEELADEDPLGFDEELLPVKTGSSSSLSSGDVYRASRVVPVLSSMETEPIGVPADPDGGSPATRSTSTVSTRREQPGTTNFVTTMDPSSSPRVALVNLDLAENTSAWFLLRRVASNIGLQYWARVQYSLVLVLLFFTLLVSMVISEAIIPDLTLIHPEVMLSAAYNLFMFLLAVIFLVYWGLRTNRLYIEQQAMLNDEQTRVRQMEAVAWDSGNVAYGTQLKTAIWMIDSVNKGLKMDHTLYPTKVMGVTSSTRVLQTVVASTLPVLIYGLRLLYCCI